MPRLFLNSLMRGLLLLAVLLLTGCASGPTADRRDPFEPFNRGVFRFNDAVDRAAIKPLATAYRDVLPSPVRAGVNNFFNNLQDAWSIVNNTLQLHAEGAGNSFFRFGVNTVFGLGGVLDIASEMRIERHTKDFGHTLGYWGVPPGPYIVMPLLGPSTLRDTAATSIDAAGNLLSRIDHSTTRNTAAAVKLLDTRAQLLGASAMLDQIALDPYTFTRDAHLQRRRASIYDGYPPDEEEVMPDLDKNPAQ
jgi:phospholipid-binding lipoprotein MlaA